MLHYILRGIVICSIAVSGMVTAGTNSTILSMKGTLIVPPVCTLNGGQKINVVFDEMGISDVDGINNTKTVDYGLVCQSTNNNPWVLNLTVRGEATSYDSAAIQAQINGSSSTDLGIKLLLDNKDFILNKPIIIRPNNPPVMTAVPVKNPGATLPEGAFTATATLVATFE